MWNELLHSLVEHLETQIGPVGAIFCVFTIILWVDNRLMVRDLMRSIPARVQTDTLIQANVARMTAVAERLETKL